MNLIVIHLSVNNLENNYKYQNGNDLASNPSENGLLNQKKNYPVAYNVNVFSAEKVYSPKEKNNNFFINHMKTMASPSQKMACMCNCSTHSSSISQSLAASPQCNQKLIYNINNNNNISSIPIIRIHNSTRINSIKKSLDSNINKDYHESDTLQSINYKKINSNYLRKSNLELAIKNHFSDFIVKLKNAIEISEMRLIENEKREVIQNEWSDLAMILDRLLFYFLSSLTVITTTFIFLNSPHTFESW